MVCIRTNRSPLLTALLLLSLGAPLAAAPPAPASPGTAHPIHLAVAGPKTPLTDVLFTLGKQTGATIIADDSVTSTLDAATLDKPTLAATLDALAALTPGLTWRRISLPPDAAVPDGNALSAQVRALTTITASHLLVTDPANGTALRFAKASSKDPSVSTQGMQTVYLVTN